MVRYGLIVATLMFTLGCAHAPKGRAWVEDTRAFLVQECPVTRGKAETLGVDLASAVVPALLEKGLDLVASSLRKAGAETATTRVAITNAHLYARTNGQLSLSPEVGCLVVSSGKFGDAPADSFPDWMTEQVRPRLLQALGVVAPPSFYFEATLRQAKDHSAISFRPRMIYYPHAFGRGSFGDLLGRHRDLVITIEFDGPNSGAESAKFAVGTVPLSDVVGAISLKGDALKGLETTWLALPEAKSALETSHPFSARVTLAETIEASRLLLFAADVLDASKPPIKEVLEKELVPAKRDAEEAAEREADQKAELAAIEARQAVEAAKVALGTLPEDASPSERQKAMAALELAQAKANIAYEAAGWRERYPIAR